MEQQDPTPIVLDTSSLLNFVKIGLLGNSAITGSYTKEEAEEWL